MEQAFSYSRSVLPQASAVSEAPSSILLMSLGGVVLDDIRIAERMVTSDSLGGAGTHATVGARIFTPSRPQDVGWKVKAGEDFPQEVEEKLRAWNISLDLRRVPGTMSPRNQLTYHDDSMGAKTFRYTTPPTSLTPSDLKGTTMLSARAFHFHVSPDLLQSQVTELLPLRLAEKLERPLILWEPTRPSCTKELLQSCTEAAGLVDLFSPNHDELAAFHGVPLPEFSRQTIEQLAQYFVDAGIGHDGAGIIAVRAAEHGCLVQARGIGPLWLPAFYEPEGVAINSKVIDTTGAGNAFLGGFAIGLLETGSPILAAHYGTVASSFMVEQVGLPRSTNDQNVGEKWNGVVVRERLEDYGARVALAKGD